MNENEKEKGKYNKETNTIKNNTILKKQKLSYLQPKIKFIKIPVYNCPTQILMHLVKFKCFMTLHINTDYLNEFATLASKNTLFACNYKVSTQQVFFG